jgi:hypothetical protein
MPERTKRPAFQFYPNDWRCDIALQRCSAAARGVWIDMLCLMHDGEPYGHLSAKGVALSSAHLARLVGISADECAALVGELEEAGVLSRTDEGVIYSRRMVRDEDVRNRRAAGGHLSQGHPNVPLRRSRAEDGGEGAGKGTTKDGGKDGGKDTLQGSLVPSSAGSLGGSPSSSSSSSSSTTETPPLSPPEGGAGVGPPGSGATRVRGARVAASGDDDEMFCAAWVAYPPRPEGDSRKAAFKAWSARVNQGADREAMLQGVQRYAAYIEATGTKVKQAATFFGPSEFYLQPWAAPGTQYTADFDAAWRALPARLGADSKEQAFQQFRRATKQGVAADAILDGCRRYADYADAAGDTGTEYALSGARFFNPDERLWERPWDGRGDRRGRGGLGI